MNDKDLFSLDTHQKILVDSDDSLDFKLIPSKQVLVVSFDGRLELVSLLYRSIFEIMMQGLNVFRMHHF